MKRGFTLTELLVAMFLTGILAVMAYGLFATTSDNLSEVDSLEASSSKARFAMERMRKLFQSAAAGATPDSETDPFVQPRPVGAFPYRVTGFYPYLDWQNDRSNYPVDVAAANLNVSTDGVVIAGSFDFPSSFEAAGFEDGNENIMTISGHFRGMDRLAVPDPFHDVIDPLTPDLNPTRNWSVAPSYDFFQNNFTTRLVRLNDAQGYLQFVSIADQFVAADVSPGTPWPFVSVELAPRDATLLTLGPKFKENGRTPNGSFPNVLQDEVGLDLSTEFEGDRAYDASFVDFFWLHVVPAPGDPNNLHLVMDRLCAPSFITDAATDISNLNPAASIPNGVNCPGSTTERYLLSDNVVDFQVWFDCANTNVVVNNIPGFDMVNNDNWTRNWSTPDHTVEDQCMAPVIGTWNPGRARVAHVRLTLRASNERANLRHYQFEDPFSPTGVCSDPLACPGATLKTFDAFPNLQGAVPLVTLQSDVKLYNYQIKDL